MEKQNNLGFKSGQKKIGNSINLNNTPDQNNGNNNSNGCC